MTKTQHQKVEQKSPKILSEENMEKISNSRTMYWLKIPPKIQQEFQKNFINVDIDYIQYTCYNIKEPLQNLYNVLGFSGQIDIDNSNIEYNYNLNLSLTHHETKMGHAYMITFFSSGFPPIPIASVEVYNPNRVKTLGTEGKIVFYGAYFVFKDIISEECPEMIRFANIIEFGTIIKTQGKKSDKLVYKRTRVDVALDVKGKISQKWLTKYIQPSKNSRHVVKPYNYQPEEGKDHSKGFQSFGYIPKLGQCIGMRIYNKVLDIRAKNKQSWYPEYGSEQLPNVTRMEIIYSGDSAMDSLENLIHYTEFRIMGNKSTTLRRKYRPKSQYSPLSAYEYFKRYSKNHGKTLKEVLDDVTCLMIVEEQKDMEFQGNMKKFPKGSEFSSTF